MHIDDTQLLLQENRQRSTKIISHGTSRQLLAAVAIIFMLCFFVAMYSQVDFMPSRHIRIQPSPLPYSDAAIKEGFLVYSENCQIPDVDPYHPTVRALVQEEPVLNCSIAYPQVTWTEGNSIVIRSQPIAFKNSGVLKCCYRTVTREKFAKSDSTADISKDCKHIKNGDIINEEFIKIECKFKGNSTLAYTNYHGFVHEKPDVEKRCSSTVRGDETTANPPYSVLIIGADAMSRLNMHRQFKKTMKYLKQRMGAIEMYGFNKVGDNTLPNLVPLLMGIAEQELPMVCRSNNEPFDKCPFFWKKYSKRGYRTLYAEDTPSISSFNYIKKGFLTQPTDYYYRPLMYFLEKHLGREKKLNCYRCVGSVSEVEAILEYVRKFANLFANRPYFAFTWTNSLTHDFLNSGSSGDVFFESFFRTLYENGDLNRTIVMFMGDHGLRWGAIRSTYIGRMEERLPMLLVSFPDEFRQKYPSAVRAFRTNSHRLMTQFDLYATLQNVLDFNGSTTVVDPYGIPGWLVENFTRRALSLFNPVPENRACEDADIDEHWCTCQKSSPTSIDDVEVNHVAEFTVKTLNKLLKSNGNCVPLVLYNVTGALLRSPHQYLRAKKDYDIFDYSVTLTTMPNGAIYESTVRYVPHKHTHELLGEVSRLNLYGDQSHCITDRKLKKYCYCKDMDIS